MPVLYILTMNDAKILFDNQRAMKGYPIGALLYSIQLGCKYSKRIISAIAYEEREIDEVVWVSELGKEVEVLGNVEGGIAEWGEDQDSFFVGDGLGCRFDGIEINVFDGRGVDFHGSVMVKENGGLEMSVPCSLLVEGHIHGRFRRAKADETIECVVSSSSIVCRGASLGGNG